MAQRLTEAQWTPERQLKYLLTGKMPEELSGYKKPEESGLGSGQLRQFTMASVEAGERVHPEQQTRIQTGLNDLRRAGYDENMVFWSPAFGGDINTIYPIGTVEQLKAAGIDVSKITQQLPSGVANLKIGQPMNKQAGISSLGTPEPSGAEITPWEAGPEIGPKDIEETITKMKETETLATKTAAETVETKGKKIEGFPQTQAQMAEWQQKYIWDAATGSWYEKTTAEKPSEITPTITEKITEIKQKAQEIQTKINQLQSVVNAATAAGISPTEDIPAQFYEQAGLTPPKEAQTTSDVEDERDAALKEAEEYYGYTLPTDTAEWGYPERLAEVEEEAGILETRTEEDFAFQQDQITAEKQKLLQEYNDYLEDIRTGRLRVGEDKELAERRRLEQQKEYLDQWGRDIEIGMENLQRGWIAKGGLFAGPRYEAAGRYMTEAEAEKGRYLSAEEYARQTGEVGYQRQMEDYLTGETRAGTAYQTGLGEIGRRQTRYEQLKERSLADIARARIKDIRSLQEEFQLAIGQRMAQTLEEQYV